MKRIITTYNWIPTRPSKQLQISEWEAQNPCVVAGLGGGTFRSEYHKRYNSDNVIIMCHKYKIYYKNFDCTSNELKYIIKSAQQKPDGVYSRVDI